MSCLTRVSLVQLFNVCLFFLTACNNNTESVKPLNSIPTLTLSVSLAQGSHDWLVADASMVYEGKVSFTSHGIVYGTNENPTLENAQVIELGSLGLKNFSYQFDGTSAMVADTDYYAKAYVKIDDQVYYSEEEKFRSLKGTWKKLASFPGSHRKLSIAFSVDEKVYMVGGMSIELHKFNDVWCYDPAIDTWTEKSAFPSVAITTDDAATFTVENTAYVVSTLGSWKYSPVDDTWEKIENGIYQSKMIAFSIGGRGYVGGGEGWGIYDSSTNSWTSLGNTTGSEYPGDATYLKYAFSSGGKGYSGYGLNESIDLILPTAEFYEYDPVANTWSKKESFLYYNNPRTGLAAFCLNDKIYFGMGRNGNDAVLGDLHAYNPVTSSWDDYIASIPAIERTDVFACASSTKGYVGLGFKYYQEGEVDKLFDFWEFKP